MRTTILGACLTVAASCCALAQSSGDQLTFEVASIKPAAPMVAGKMMFGSRGGPGSADPGHLTYNNLSLKNLLVNAYGVKSYQVTGPSWLDSERFDIVAKIPEGTTKDQVKIMLQNLLKERFNLEIHHETKDLPMYALVVGKGGPKMKPSPEDPAPPAAVTGGPNDASAPKPPDPADLAKAMGKLNISADGTIKLPPGMGPREGCMMMMMMSPSGPKTHMQCSKQTMPKLVDQLSMQMDKPVNDLTGLTAKYDFNLDFLPDENGMSKTMMPMGGAGGPNVGFTRTETVGGPGHDAPAQKEEVSVPPLPAALQEQLGLKLEQKKGPVDMIVVDKMEKVPTEN
jgi:uncharacterized protein (TIGR03435 family)